MSLKEEKGIKMRIKELKENELKERGRN